MQEFFVRCDGRYTRLELKDIRYVESLGNYVRIVTTSRSHLVLMSLRQLEEWLPEDRFCRTHRSFIVALEHVDAFDHETVFMEQDSIPISSGYRHILLSKVHVLISDNRNKIDVRKGAMQ